MRDIITGIAIIVIVILTAALAAPYFIDWTSQRSFVEARLSHALGQKVTIGGGIDVKLLPTPYLVLDQAVIGGDDGPIRIGIRHLDLELSVTPLLHGEFEVVDAKLEEPTIRVTLDPDRTLPSFPMGPAFEADVRFDRVTVADGTLAIADPTSGHTFVFDDLNFDADAPSLAGPFKITGTEGPPLARTKFRIATTTAQNGRARAHLVVAETPTHAGLDLDGTVALSSVGRQTVRQSFDGTLAASGHLDQGAGLPITWRLSGPLKADPARAVLAGGELRIGSEEAGLRLTAAGEADLGAAPSLHLDLSGKQLDIDRLAGGPIDADGKTTRPPPPTVPDLATLQRAIAAATPPLPTALDVSIDTATWGGETLSDLALHVGFGGQGSGGTGARRLQIGGDGPGGAHVGVDGMIGDAPNERFSGAVELAADNAQRALGWLAVVAPSLGVAPSDVPFRTIKLAGKVEAGTEAITATGLALALDRSTLTGTTRLAFGSRPKLTADLQAKALDLDALPDLARLRTAAGGMDLDLTLAANAIKVSRVGDGTLDAGHIDLVLKTRDGHIGLQRLQVQNLGGANVFAMGTLDADGGTLIAKLDSTDLDDAAALVRELAPGAAADALVARAPALAPAKLTIDAAFTGMLAPSRVKIGGKLGATVFTASLTPDAATKGVVSLAATLDAPEGSALLRQLGLPTLPLDLLGKSRLTIAAKGPADKPLDTTIQGTFGATQAGVAGRFTLLAGAPAGSGTFTMKSADVSPLLQSLALAFPDMTGAIPATMTGGLALGDAGFAASDLTGTFAGVGVGGALRWQPDKGDRPTLTGALALDRLRLADLVGLALGPPQPPAPNAGWSNLAFGTGLVDPPRAAITLTIGALDLLPSIVAMHAKLELGVARNRITLTQGTAMLAGGMVAGDLSLRRDGPQGALEGKIKVDRVGVDLPGLKTGLTASLDVAGSGPSALGLVSSLAGTGTATLDHVVIPGADPVALPKIFAAVESDDLAVDQDAVARALRDAAKAPLDAGTRSFTLNLAGGTIGLDEANAPAGDVTLAGTIDLRRLAITETARETLRDLPKGWTGPPPSVTYKLDGFPAAPTRSIDVSGFIDAVATRALARESARIEAYEFDIRERALFNQRLQSERRREQDRLKAEADTRKAEADRKAKLDAARAEEKAARDAAAAKAFEAPSAPPADSAPTQDPSAAGRY